MASGITTFKVFINRIPAGIRPIVAVLFGTAVFALAVALLRGGLAYTAKSFAPVSRIEMNDIANMDRAEILFRAGIANHSYWTLNEALVRTNLLAIAATQDVKVDKRFPDRLIITIIPRKPVAMIGTRVNNAMSFLFVDASGKVFEKGSSPTLPSLPIITDPFMGNVFSGAQMSGAVVDFLAILPTLSEDLLGQISEIVLDWKIVDGRRLDMFDLLVYPKNASGRARMKPYITDIDLKMMFYSVSVEEEKKLRDGFYEIDCISNGHVISGAEDSR